jgi:HAD superfamily hydrolase (TIGR01549 family)
LSALIFDFDGVIADSEALANTVLAEFITDLGHPTNLEDSLEQYSGRRWDDAITAIESAVGKPLPGNFSDDLKVAILDRFRTDLTEVSGARRFIEKFSDVPRCIASSSSIDRLQLCLQILNLADKFGSNVFSSDMVSRGKPHPDIFLLAADKLGMNPRSCLVIEDSASGIKAAVAAGMTAVGLCAASHIRLDSVKPAPCTWPIPGTKLKRSRRGFLTELRTGCRHDPQSRLTSHAQGVVFC